MRANLWAVRRVGFRQWLELVIRSLRISNGGSPPADFESRDRIRYVQIYAEGLQTDRGGTNVWLDYFAMSSDSFFAPGKGDWGRPVDPGEGGNVNMQPDSFVELGWGNRPASIDANQDCAPPEPVGPETHRRRGGIGDGVKKTYDLLLSEAQPEANLVRLAETTGARYRTSWVGRGRFCSVRNVAVCRFPTNPGRCGTLRGRPISERRDDRKSFIHHEGSSFCNTPRASI